MTFLIPGLGSLSIRRRQGEDAVYYVAHLNGYTITLDETTAEQLRVGIVALQGGAESASTAEDPRPIPLTIHVPAFKPQKLSLKDILEQL